MRYASTVALALATATLAGCCATVNCTDNIGSTHVAVLSVTKFDDYKNTLQPTFKLTPDEALKASVQDTMQIEQGILDAFSARVGIKVAPSDVLPSGFGDDGESGADTPAITLNPGERAPKAILDKAGLGTDPHLAYLAATSLYQEVQLLNRYVQDAAIKKGYKAYIVRLQITNMPYLRFQPYDSYVNVGFFQGGADMPMWAGANPVDGGWLIGDVESAVDNPRGNDFVEKLRELFEDYRDDVNRQIARFNSYVEGSQGDSLSVGNFVIEAIHDLEKSYSKEIIDKIQSDLEVSGLNVVADEFWAESLAEIERIESAAVSEIENVLKSREIPAAPIVIPLLVTDQVEAALASRRADHLQQLALSLSAAYAGIQGSVDLESVREAMRSGLGREYNSLFTVGRLSDNTLRVRIGARQHSGLRGKSAREGAKAGTEFEMIPQTHNVTVLVLVDQKYVEKCAEEITVLTDTVFVNTDTGESIRPRSKLEHASGSSGVRPKFEIGQFDGRARELYAAYRGSEGDIEASLPRLRDHVWRGDREAFFQVLRDNDSTLTDSAINSYWFTLTSEFVGSGYAKATFTAMKYPTVHPHIATQTVILQDDGKATKVVIRDAQGVDLDRVTARWEVRQEKSSDQASPEYAFPITAKRIPDSSSLELTFPSLKSLGVSGSKRDHNLVVSVRGADHPVSTSRFDESFEAVYRATPSANPQVKASFAPSKLTATVPGATERALVFVIEKPTSGKVALSVTGAGLVKSLQLGTTKVEKHQGTLGVYRNLQPGKEYTLVLESLVAGEKLELKFTSTDHKEQTSEILIAAPPKN
ncbi:MAG: hypothetical protein ACIAQF_06850 [Phycisphaerales bacterium JB065]